MDFRSAPLSFDVLTEVEWRRSSDGKVLSAAVQAPMMVTFGVLPIDLWPDGAYEIWARPGDGSGDWVRLYEVDPAASTVARFDL